LSSLFTGNVWATDYTQDANCQGAWLFTEGSGTTVADSSVNTNTGNFASDGHPSWSATVPAAYAAGSADFVDGSSDYIDCGTDSSLNVTGTALSIVIWKSKNHFNGNYTLVQRGAPGAQGWTFRDYTTAGKMSKFGVVDIWINGDLGTTDWQHVAGTWASGDNNLYINGVAQTSNNNTQNFKTSTNNFYIGRGETYFDGKISETAEFNDTLNSTEVNDIMDNGLVGSAPPAAVGKVIMISG